MRGPDFNQKFQQSVKVHLTVIKVIETYVFYQLRLNASL